MKHTNILIVDDHALIRASLTLIINSNPKYSVIGTANTGNMAIDFLTKTKVDVVLMDITMPEMNGIDATHYISRNLIGPKIIGLSMHNEIDFIKEMINAGASGYLNKDCDPQELFLAIDEVMDGGNYIFKYI